MTRALKIKMNPLPANGKRRWSEAQRRAQGEIARARKPWLSSTGPKTAKGRKICSRNALKHGGASAQAALFRRVCRLQSRYVRSVTAKWREMRRENRAALCYVADSCINKAGYLPGHPTLIKASYTGFP